MKIYVFSIVGNIGGNTAFRDFIAGEKNIRDAIDKLVEFMRESDYETWAIKSVFSEPIEEC